MMNQSERKEFDRDVHKLLELTSEVAETGSWSLDPDDNSVFWSNVTKKILEVGPDFIPSPEKSLWSFARAEYRDQFADAVSDALEHGKPFELESIMVTAKGNDLWIKTIGRCEQKDGRTVRLFGTVQDITERKSAQLELQKKANMLKAISIATEALLAETDIYSAVSSCLMIIGKAVNADRVYLFQNSLTPEKTYVSSQKFEWNSGIATPQIDNPELQEMPLEIFEEFLEDMLHKTCFNTIVDELPGNSRLKADLESQDIKSILIFPIFCFGQFWGYVGFDECKYNRRWTDDDVSILQSFCNSIATSIERDSTAKELYNLSLFPQENPNPVFRIDLQGKIVLKNTKSESFPRFTFLDKEFTLDEFAVEIAGVISKDHPVHQYEITADNTVYQITSALSQNQVHINNYGENITSLKIALHDLELARRAAEESSNIKEMFISNMSHELRTPLNAIMGFLRELARGSLAPDHNTYVKNASLASKHLLSIINDVLDVIKIRSNQIRLNVSNFNIHDVIDEAVSILTPVAQEKLLEISVIKNQLLSPYYVGDASRIEQILINLLSNAVKYTGKGSISLECDVIGTKTDTHRILLRISDTGIGMDASFLDLITEKFSKNDFSSIGKNSSIGGGMDLILALVNLMNGKIYIASKTNVGTTVSVELELKIATAGLAKTVTPQGSYNALKNKNILLVEDNFLNRLVVCKSLQFYEMNTIEAVNGLEAIEILKNRSVDLILMDLQMPHMSGLEATGVIRKEMNIRTPIIALTANVYKEEIERCLRAGMNDYVTKPFDEIVLIETILKHIMVPGTEPPLPQIRESEDAGALLFDLSYIVSMSRGNHDFIHKMITVFMDEIPVSVSEIIRAWDNKDFDTIRKTAHRIKPTIANFGISELSQDIRTIELLAEEKLATEELDLRIQKLEKVTQKVVTQMSEAKY